MEKFFGLSKNKTNVKTEIIAGITTFMAMAYILMVNPGMFSELEGVSFGAAYIATALPAIIGTVLIGLMANLPLAQAPGMGLNAFFVYTVCMGLGFSFANALLFVLADGLIFVILTVTGLRKVIFNAIPESVKKAVPAGIGLFIAFLGFQNAGLVIDDGATLVKLASFNVLGDATWATIMPLLVTIFALIAIAVMSKLKVKGAILFGILGGAVLYYALGFTIPEFYNGFLAGENAPVNPIEAFKAFGTETFGKVFTEGFDFSAYLAKDGNSTASLVIAFITTALAFCMVDMFDTMGTLYGACRGGNMLIKKADGTTEVPNMNKAMLADAIATCTGAVCGTSTVTTFVESSAGVAVGGRTGLSSLVTAALFGVALFLSPVAALVPAAAYAAALIYVGILMIGCVKDIKWDDPAVALPAFLTLTMMPFTYNISYGIAFGLISHVFIKVFTGKIKEVSLGTWVISILFGAMFFLTH
ncbi:MAG: NCS2 family permease [Acutalibacteraceae bacterium]|nr:NCS2 family permease [Acutalibacteraceae bacterium]